MSKADLPAGVGDVSIGRPRQLAVERHDSPRPARTAEAFVVDGQVVVVAAERLDGERDDDGGDSRQVAHGARLAEPVVGRRVARRADAATSKHAGADDGGHLFLLKRVPPRPPAHTRHPAQKRD